MLRVRAFLCSLIITLGVTYPSYGGDLTTNGVTIEAPSFGLATLRLKLPPSTFSFDISGFEDTSYGYLLLDQTKTDRWASLRLRTRIAGAPNTNLNLMSVEGGGTAAAGGQFNLFKLDAINANDQTIALHLNAAGASYFNGGNVGVGTKYPTAKLEVKGTVKVSDEVSGVEELSVSNIGVAIGGGNSIQKVVSTTYLFPAVAVAADGGTSPEYSVPGLTGFSANDTVIIGLPYAPPIRKVVSGYVNPATGQVVVRAVNSTPTAASVGSAFTIRVTVIKFGN
jgi:hypothetical protein